MIKKIYASLRKRARSLKSGMLLAIIFSLVLGLSIAFLSRMMINNWIDQKYNSEERKRARYDDYIEDLQTYVSEKGISSNDTSKITYWVHRNRNIYLFLYKDNQLFFDSSIENDNKDEDAGEDVIPDEDQNDSDPNAGAEGEDNDSIEDDPDEVGDREDSNITRPGGGITVDYPTREEIVETAKKNGLRQLELSDGTLFVALADFTDYIYYDVANITGLVIGVLIVVLCLMLYFQKIIFKISRLAKDVSSVYEVDMNKPIRYDEGKDELSTLTRNVEQMRSSMIDSLDKEKKAIEANTELITSMSHDIRTPLTVLLGYLDIMKASTQDELMQEYIKASESTAMRLKDLSDDMFRYFLVFGDKENNAAIISEYDAKTLIEQLFTEHILLLSELGYNIRLNIAHNIKENVRVLTDAPKTMRVVDNLFSNIHKYADPEKEISVEAGLSYGKLVCVVKNYILSNKEGKESNRIGLKTCEKICDSLDVGFKYHITGAKNQKMFVVHIEFPIKRDNTEEYKNV